MGRDSDYSNYTKTSTTGNKLFTNIIYNVYYVYVCDLHVHVCMGPTCTCIYGIYMYIYVSDLRVHVCMGHTCTCIYGTYMYMYVCDLHVHVLHHDAYRFTMRYMSSCLV